MSDDEKTTKDDTWPDRPERVRESTHQVSLGGHTVEYTAQAGTLTLTSDKDEPQASMFYTAYLVESDEPRPVTFCFNGGPGSSAAWLHLGAFGPRRVDMPDAEAPPPPPHRLVDNDCGILDATDLVFVDPVGTGFSRVLGEAEKKDFHSVTGDIESVGRFIEQWLTRNHRWNAPRYLAGESYGTTRAAGVANWLAERGVSCNGLVLLSLALDFQTFVFEMGNDLPNVLFLPTYAATAWYHERIEPRPDDLRAFLERARTWAVERYAPALLLGTRLSEDRCRELAEELTQFTGIDVDTLVKRRLRIEDMWFAKNLLGDQRSVGRLDSRYVGPDDDPFSHKATRDPSFDAPYGPYTAVINDYLRRELGWDTDDPYVVISLDVNRSWTWDQEKRWGYTNTTGDLRKALLSNPHLKVFLANGLFDLATPFFGSEYTIDHLDVSPEVRQNVTIAEYEAGHMMYIHEPSRQKLRDDLITFYG